MSPLLPRPSRALASAALAGALGFAALVGLGIHGYSISIWHSLLDGSEPSEILLGEPRPIRSDDYLVVLGLAHAQVTSEPAFPLVNREIGMGQNMLVPFAAPVAHPLTLFRPTTWGFFLGPDAGMAWLWWSRAIGLVLAWLLVFEIVTGGRTAASLLGATALAASPFVLFWGARPAPVLIYSGLAFVAALGVVGARGRAAIAGFGLLLGWSGAAFALTLYPPFQVALGTLLGVLFAALLWCHRDRLEPGRLLAWRVAAAALAAAVVAGALALLLRDAGDAIDLLRNTAFPGDRVSTGGERSLAELAGANLAAALRVEDWGPLVNVCEAAVWWVLSPAVLAAALWQRLRGGRRFDAVEIALALVALALVLHAVVGVPEWLARATGWSLVPGRRSAVALGPAELLLLLRLLSNRTGAPLVGRIPAAVVAALWGGALGLAAWKLTAELPELGVGFGLTLAAGNAAVALLALRSRRVWQPLAAVAACSLVVSAWFNPVVRGGTSYLRENPISARILEIDGGLGGESVWLAFGRPELPNLFRFLGVRALNGVHPVPHFALWRAFDPAGRYRRTYNRYAHVSFVAWKREGFRVRTWSPDTLVANVHPRARALRALGVTHFLVHTEEPAAFAELSGHRLVESFGALHVFEAVWPAAAPPAAPLGEPRRDG